MALALTTGAPYLFSKWCLKNVDSQVQFTTAHWHHLCLVAGLAAKGQVGRVLVELLKTTAFRRSSHVWSVRNSHLNRELSTVLCIVLTALSGKLPLAVLALDRPKEQQSPEMSGTMFLALVLWASTKVQSMKYSAGTITLWFIWSVMFRSISLLPSHHSILKPPCVSSDSCQTWNAERHRACLICLSYTGSQA